MIVRTLSDLEGTERDVRAATFKSRRLLLASDKAGFSLHDTVLFAGTTTHIWYKHHLEAVYCVEGRGELKELPDGPTHIIEPGTMYCLDQHEEHNLTALEDLRVVCVFTPALVGNEVHREDGSYAPADEMPSGGA